MNKTGKSENYIGGFVAALLLGAFPFLNIPLSEPQALNLGYAAGCAALWAIRQYEKHKEKKDAG